MSSSSAPQKVSFTVRRPTPESRGISPGSDDELVTGFDRFGVQRAFEKKKAKEGPLVIPALKNKDWRELARKRRSQGQFVPDSAKTSTGADGSVGGLGTRETINTGPVISGLQVRKKRETVEVKNEDGDVVMNEEVQEEEVTETEEQRALRALLAEANGQVQDDAYIAAIPTPISEADALKQDVDELPDVATLEDYERVPVSQFGAAMLRGMGWKEGQAASRKGKGMIEPYIPAARPALLGIGAKEQEVYDDGSKLKRKSGKPPLRYMPVARLERTDSGDPQSRDRSRSPKRSSTTRSRHTSRSPDRADRSRYDRDDSSKRRRDRDDYGSSRDKDRDRDYRRSKESGRDRERNGDRDRDRDNKRDRERDRGRRRDYDYDRSRRDSERRRDY
ncbi:hypothetical protein CC1G_02029 [Coprinopsis cinerea okayama7|uniref:G-patch domain-containing protein n=1 Tax=Coprinopsis cinerea (strain Okayama-7 / 130 / ATCC MYA-4618 / FGSC 9003) TaxID=240176 RepID=A8N6C4_COPC7|nr:hypothetical protein CC1G_02029 [Coprinopsis cinerea okayama7\|eukprot:XP_001830393.2 hypothetical protein CC1G_02029 [Coprinopsis cinerea okayama7\